MGINPQVNKSREHNINAPCSEFAPPYYPHLLGLENLRRSSPKFLFPNSPKNTKVASSGMNKCIMAVLSCHTRLYRKECLRRCCGGIKNILEFSIDKTSYRGSRILMTNRHNIYFSTIPMHSVAVQIRQFLNAFKAIYRAVDMHSAFMSSNLKRLGDSVSSIGDMNLTNGLRNKEII